MPQPKQPVHVEGHGSWPSIKEAAEDLGVSTGTLHKNFHRGTLAEAIPYWRRGESVPLRQGRPIRMDKKDYANVREAAEDIGVTTSTIYHRLKRGRGWYHKDKKRS